ncbi:hypothetical protein Btru_072284, partial [Bulinus truncatus]
TGQNILCVKKRQDGNISSGLPPIGSGWSRDGTPPALCNGKYCIQGQATCVSDDCVCNNPPYTHGDGYFNCYKKSQVRAEVLNDPTLNTIGNETSQLTVPCRVLLASLRQELKRYVGKPVNIGFCYIQVHTFQTRSKGKFYAAGYEVALKLEYANGTKKELSSIVFGPQGGVQLNGTDNAYLPDGPYGNDAINYVDAPNNIFVKRYYDASNDQYVFEVDACGIRATLVPYDTSSGLKQSRVPGVSVAINCIHHPKYLDNDQCVGLVSKAHGGKGLEDLQAMYPGTTTAQALATFAFTRSVNQIQPYVSDQCPVVSSSLGNCDSSELPVALNNCQWIFTATKFVDCISGPGTSSSAVLNLYRLCIDQFCNGGGQCSALLSAVGSCGSQGGSQLTNLISTACPAP